MEKIFCFKSACWISTFLGNAFSFTASIVYGGTSACTLKAIFLGLNHCDTCGTKCFQIASKTSKSTSLYASSKSLVNSTTEESLAADDLRWIAKNAGK